MRKADYQALAQHIREGIAFAQVQRDAKDAAADSGPYYRGRIDALRTLAKMFATGASVDRAAFLKACGIDT